MFTQNIKSMFRFNGVMVGVKQKQVETGSGRSRRWKARKYAN
jgi:hypothetical protein